MNIADMHLEWHHIMEQRLAQLCQNQAPTGQQVIIAKTEADRWLLLAVLGTGLYPDREFPPCGIPYLDP